MKVIRISLMLTSLILLVYGLSPLLGIGYSLIVLLFLLANIALIQTVFVVLKNGTPSKKTWDEGYWYEDLDKKFGE